MLSLEEISARVEIYDALLRYCRGIDRRDHALIQSAYFPDALDQRAYNPDDASPKGIADRAVAGFGELPEYSQHHITNVIIELDIAAGVAKVESYHIAFHPVGPETSLKFAPEDGQCHLRFAGGRYLDRFECRNGEWRIAERVSVVDWSRDDIPGNPIWPTLREGFLSGAVGADPSYTKLGMKG